MKKSRIRRAPSPATTDGATRTPDGPPTGGPFPIVGIGASAGGLEAFSTLLKHLPLDTGMGFVLVQHLDPDHDSALTQLLGRATSLPVHEVTDRLRVEPNHVYVIPRNTNLGIVGGVLTLQPRPQTRGPHRSIDFFLEALAADQHQRAIGVILSGTATDGTLGLEAIKAEGGITFAQDDSARYDSMPQSAVAAGTVDFVLSPEQIAHEIARIAKHPYVAGAAAEGPTQRKGDRASGPTGANHTRAEAESDRPTKTEEKGTEDGFKKVLLLLRNHSGVDFSLYKSSTIQRRITRRMVLSKHETHEEYVRFLRGNTKELDALYSDLLISVTSFFRNPEAFDVLQRKVWPALVGQPGDEPLRIWVPGCSTGQEAYSIAMAFVEAAEKAPRLRKLQVFATDLNDALLDKARHGLYAKSVVQDVSPDRLRRFFVEEEGGYRVSKSLREMVVFARQNVISDPPFSRMDIISCRNLLIYFESGSQKKIFPVFHYALKPGGFLYLGASESIGGFADLFEPVDKKHRIYVKKAAPTPAFQLSARKERGEARAANSRQTWSPVRMHAESGGVVDGFRAELSAQREADRITVNQFAPPAVLINDELQILQFRGPTGAYLEPATGKASFDVLKMARNGLMLPLRTAINKAKKDNKTIRKEDVRIDQDGQTRTVDLQVIPLKSLRERCFLIVFEDAAKPGPASLASQAAGGKHRGPEPRLRGARSRESRRVAELETDLAETRDYLQSIQEHHGAANEELQASNEEVQSANEELQSINEEMETSKEELESANEELSTVTEEMATRNAELNGLNSDLINVQNSSQVTLVLLDRNLTIRRFSAQAAKQFNLLASDVGRPIGNVRHNLDLFDLEPLITDVIDTVRAHEREVQDKDGRWYSLRVRPYLTLDNKVDGAVLVLVDITDLKRSEQAIAAARDYAEENIRKAPGPLLILKADLRVEMANDAFCATFNVSREESEGRLVYDLGNQQWNIPRLRQLLEEILPRDNDFDRFEVTHDFPTIGRRTMLLNARTLSDVGDRPDRILLGIHDVTLLVAAQGAALQSHARYQALVETSAQIVWTTDPKGAVVEDSPSWRAFTGQTLEQWQGFGWLDAIHPDDVVRVRKLWLHAVSERKPVNTEYRVRHVSGDWRWAQVRAVPVLNPDDTVREWVGMNIDITDRKQAEGMMRESDRHKNEFLAMLAHELRNPLAPILVSIEIIRLARRLEAADGPDQQRTEEAGDVSSGTRLDLSYRVEHALDVLQRQVGQMVRLIDDLLDAGRISRGKIELRRERVELSSVVRQAAEAVRPLAERSGQELTVMLPTFPVYVDADPTRLAQILGNLLNNACKFTDRGGRISLMVERAPESGSEDAEGMLNHLAPEIVLRVRDTGIGIAPDRLESIFEMFTQIDTSLERSATGLGIGLTLVRTLAEMHGGAVEATSPGVGHGSEFVVRLPIVVEAPTEAPLPPTTEPLTPRRILIVDDNRDSAEMLAVRLNLSGHETVTVHDGLAAVEAAIAHRPDVILLDIGLPGLNGYEAVRRIREQQTDGDRPLLVALTGWGQDEDRRRSEEAGFDTHLVKPIDDVVLRKLLAELGTHKQEVER